MAIIRSNPNKKLQAVASQFVGEPKIGDRFSQIDATGQVIEDWIFDGSIWISTSKKSEFNFIDLSSTKTIILSIDKDHDLLVDSLKIDYSIAELARIPNINSNYWSLNLYRTNTALGKTLINSTGRLTDNYGSLTIPINLQDRINLNQTLFYQLEAEETGKQGNLSISGKLNYRFWRIDNDE